MSVLPFARQLFRTLIISLPIVSVAATTSVDATDSGVVVLPLGPAYATDTADTRVPAEPVESTAPVMPEGEATRPVTIAMLMPSDESPFLPAARIVGNGLLTASRVSGRNANIMLIEAPAVSYTHLRAHETDSYLVCRLLLEKKKKTTTKEKKKRRMPT